MRYLKDHAWSKVAIDLFSHSEETFIVIVDYYSNFIKFERIKSISSHSVIQALKTGFGCHGIPESLASDNRPAYVSEEFRKFASQWDFQHITTSPHYAQSNGKAESAVKICKALLKKAQLAKPDIATLCTVKPTQYPNIANKFLASTTTVWMVYKNTTAAITYTKT